MDQTILNWAFGLAGGLGGWILKVIWDAMKELRQDMRQIERDLSEIYVRKDDFRDSVKDIKEMMHDGFNKVDNTLLLLFKKIDGKEDKE